MSIETIHQNFKNALMQHDRGLAVQIAIEALRSGALDIRSLYEEVLAPSLNQIASNNHEQEVPIWEEHVQSNIVRTVLENAFPYVLKESASTSSMKALIFCVEEEYHEIGARMTTDFLTILGFDATFIGANTPTQEIVRAIKFYQPVLIGCSLTNYYHLTKLHKLIDRLKTELPDQHFKVLVGGYAVFHTSNVKDLIQADYYAHTFEDLLPIKDALLPIKDDLSPIKDDLAPIKDALSPIKEDLL